MNANLERPPFAATRSCSSIRAFPSGPSVSSPCQRDFRLLALSRWPAHGVPLPLAPTRLGYGDVSLASRRALRQSLYETRRCPPIITYEDEGDPRVFAHPAQSPSEKTSTIGCSTCLLFTIKHLGLPLRKRTRHLRACMFLVFGCCIRLASSLTANCSHTCLD